MLRTRVAACGFGVAAIVAAGLLGGWMFQHQQSGGHASSKQAAAPEQPGGAPRLNRLAKESSPYLQLHKHNPVDWYPWGPEAFERARKEDKLIFLSIGYSSCYWCHVMERESFSDPEIAAVLNEHFVCIKVDREELPDVDEQYMNAVHAMELRGGWPLSLFLTPERKPFFGGTYWPPTRRGEMTGFTTVLQGVIAAWHEQRDHIVALAEQVARRVERGSRPRGFATRDLDRSLVTQTVTELTTQFDPEHGGFGFDPRMPRRPKFPEPAKLRLLLYAVRADDDARALGMLQFTLDRLARGGIWDHVGGGFHRYSVDRFWQVPHFEKMLYDNAQLAAVYLEAFELTGEERYRRQAEAIFAFVAREMTAPEGGFYAALDAESEHEEGKYYVWTEQEIRDLLTAEEFPVFAAVYGLYGPANFEGQRYVLQQRLPLGDLAESAQLAAAELDRLLEPMRQKLLDARSKRARPLLDTKTLTDWNGLMVAALADGFRIVGDQAYGDAAERAADLLLSKVRAADGRLLHTYTAGTAKIPAYLEDHAFLLGGLLALHRATKEARWLAEARTLADRMIALFWDESAGGFFSTAADQEVVLARIKPSRDSVWPAGNSAAVRALVALAAATGEDRYAEVTAKTLTAFAGNLADEPTEYPEMVRGLAEYLDAGFPAVSGGAGQRQQKAVRARAFLSLDRLQPGREFHLAVRLDIGSEWHIYANPPVPSDLYPVTLDVSSQLPLEDVAVQYPKPVPMTLEGIDVPVAGYVGRALLRARARLSDQAKPGQGELKLSIRYQAANDLRCLAPQEIELVVPVEVAAVGEPVREILPEVFGRPTTAQ